MVYKSKNKHFYELIFDSMDSLIQYADVNGFKKKAFLSSGFVLKCGSITFITFIPPLAIIFSKYSNNKLEFNWNVVCFCLHL